MISQDLLYWCKVKRFDAQWILTVNLWRFWESSNLLQASPSKSADRSQNLAAAQGASASLLPTTFGVGRLSCSSSNNRTHWKHSIHKANKKSVPWPETTITYHITSELPWFEILDVQYFIILSTVVKHWVDFENLMLCATRVIAHWLSYGFDFLHFASLTKKSM